MSFELIPVTYENERIELTDGPEPVHLTLKEMGMKETALEEFIRNNPGLLFNDEQTLQIVGHQTYTNTGKKSDLIGVTREGDLVLIEVKRDAGDAISRPEAFEMQAIRYVASLSTIKSLDELITKIFVPYINKFSSEFTIGEGWTVQEFARHILVENFLDGDAVDLSSSVIEINNNQQIVLAATGFDEETLSASTWLSSNGVQIRCVAFKPTKIEDLTFLQCETMIPIPPENTFIIGIPEKGSAKNAKSNYGPKTRTIDIMKMFEVGILQNGDKLTVSTSPNSLRIKENSEAIVIDGKYVDYHGEQMPYNSWGKKVTGWSSISIPGHAVLRDEHIHIHRARYLEEQKGEN